MIKYKLEDNINFYDELYKSLDNDNDNEDTNNLCLISNMPLIDNYVTMECGHKFNYIPLYKDIFNFKNNFNSMESINKLKHNEIRCPYCRHKQNVLLPYYENIGLPKVHGINLYYGNVYPCFDDKCKYIISKLNENENIYCNQSYCTPIKQLTNIVLQEVGTLDTNVYCYNHKKIMIQKYKHDYKEKEKLKQKEAKLKLKEEEKQAKIKLKEEEKQAKIKLKEQEKVSNLKEKSVNANKQNENIILGKIILDKPISEGCLSILKTGLGKGTPCGSKIFCENEKICKRHYNSKYKNQTI
jgi:hypothetical protein